MQKVLYHTNLKNQVKLFLPLFAKKSLRVFSEGSQVVGIDTVLRVGMMRALVSDKLLFDYTSAILHFLPDPAAGKNYLQSRFVAFLRSVPYIDVKAAYVLGRGTECLSIILHSAHLLRHSLQ